MALSLRIFTLISTITLIQCASPYLEEFAAGNREFTASVYKELAQEEKGNFLVCPLSVEIVMALAGLGARGETSGEISRGIKLPEDPERTKQIFSELLPQLRGDENYALNLANRLYVKEGDVLNETYKANAERLFNAGVENIDFSNNVKAAIAINNWVEQKTNNKIHDLIKPQDLDANTRLILINALHFKANWKHKFDSFDTIKRPFYLDNLNTTSTVDMMQITDYFNYYASDDLDCQFLEMPYQGDDVAMVFVLPNKRDGLKQLEERAGEVFKVQPFSKQQVKVQIPKFTIETTIKFKPILEKLGVQKAFAANADFSGISKENLFIDKVVQKTFINVTEKGTEAAAASAGGVVTLSIPAPSLPVELNFIADHPFLLALQYTEPKNTEPTVILFSGRYVKPSPTPVPAVPATPNRRRINNNTNKRKYY